MADNPAIHYPRSVADVPGLSGALDRHMYVPRHGLDRFAAALANVTAARVPILVLGDSISQGFFSTTPMRTNGWVGQLKTALQARYGGTSEGFVSIGDSLAAAPSLTGADIRWVPSGAWSNGFDGFGAQLAKSTAINAYYEATITGDRVDLLFMDDGASTGGTVIVSIDGTPQTPVAIKSAYYANRVLSYTGLGAGAHTVQVKVSEDTKRINFHGAAGYTGTAGVVVHQHAVAGQGVGSYTNVAAKIPMTIAPFGQALTVIALGTNDCTAGNAIDTTYAQGLSTFIESAYAKNSDVLLVSFSHNPTSANDSLYWQYPDRMQRIAREYGCPYLNVWGRHHHGDGAWRLASGLYGASATDIHPSTTGHTDIKTAVMAMLAAYGL